MPLRDVSAGLLVVACIVSPAAAGTVLTLPASGTGAVDRAGLTITNTKDGQGGNHPGPFAVAGIATGKSAGGVLGRTTNTGGAGVYGLNSGSGFGGYFLMTGAAAGDGDSALAAVNDGGNKRVNGPYGGAGFFEIGNTHNTDTALFVETFGNGNAFHAETHGAETASAAEGYDYSSIGGTGVFGYSLNGTAAEFIHGAGGGNSCSFDGASSGWSCTSTAALMENRSPVDFDALLHRLSALPIAYFATKGAARPAREIGPTAEDFRAAFGLGRDDRSIAEGNATGIALAAAQGLYRKLAAAEAEIAAQRQRMEALEKELVAQRSAVASLTRAIGARLAAEPASEQAAAAARGRLPTP